jgi:thymidylate synthase (FAD)
MNNEHDILSNLPEKSIRCLDHGHVTLVDTMPRLAPEGQTTGDYAIVQAARVSYGAGTKTVNEDRGLIRYLLRHAHTTPFEMVEFKFHCKMPIIVARQWIRHRTANVNEVSGRYSVLKDEFYLPEAGDIHKQSTINKQGGDEFAEPETAAAFSARLEGICTEAYQEYEKAIAAGVSREQARMMLPASLYTEWYWKIDLHNLFHFLALRCDAHAQYEIRVFADAMLKLIEPIVPFAVEAWNDYHPMRGAVKLTRLEVAALRKEIEILQGLNPEGTAFKAIVAMENKREQAEWESKAKLFFGE